MKTVFISRFLTATSPFQNILNTQGYRVHGESLLCFEAVNFDSIPMTDWIFFYSKNAIRFFFDTLKTNHKTIILTPKYATIGAGTAAVLKEYEIIPDFVGTGQPHATAMAFKNVAQGQMVLFPRAYHSRQSIQKILSDDLLVKDIVVYKNKPKTNIQLPKNFDYLVFTSSMNIKVYYQHHTLQAQQKIIVIGPTTAKTLRNLGIHQFIIAKETTEAALAAAILEHG